MKQLGTLVGVLAWSLVAAGCAWETGVDASEETGSAEAAVLGQNGLSSNGIALNGLTRNGITVNGISPNGLTRNGITVNGITVNALNKNGLSTSNGITVNGITLNGMPRNGLTGNGFSPNGLTRNALTHNGLSSNRLAANGLEATNAGDPGSVSGVRGEDSSLGFAAGTSHGRRAHLTSGYRFVELDANGASTGVVRDEGLYPKRDLGKVAAATNGELVEGNAPLRSTALWLARALKNESLSVDGPLSTDAGLASGYGLMASPGGQMVAAYLVKCALPEGRSVVKYDQDGNAHVLEGSIGVAAEWEEGSCGTSCQEWMTACLLAHVNLTGQHVYIWITAEHPAVELTRSNEFPLEEAAFFGNLFAEKPEAYVCHGENAMEHPIAGRVCDGAADCPYVNPYSLVGGRCSSRQACAAALTEDGQASGYAACSVGSKTYSRVITTWKP